ncbi:MAG: cupin domain-containing protein [Oscillospiraceae bacterium]|nr:cupin domain-containing protein [Oscillospiraceae bacterium]
MIKRYRDMPVTREEHLRGGDGVAEITDLLSVDEMRGAGRLFCITRLAPGASIGPHTHTGDFETYYIIKGRARVNDNGEQHDLEPGDILQCEDGNFHGIACAGDETLEYLAAILYSK